MTPDLSIAAPVHAPIGLGNAGIGIAGSALDRQRSFAAALGTAERRVDSDPSERPGAKHDRSPEAMLDRLKGQMERLVAQNLVQPILRQAREANQAPPPWGPTPAENQMAALLDEQVALDITRRANFPIVDQMARQMLQRTLGEASAAGDGAQTPETPAAR